MRLEISFDKEDLAVASMDSLTTIIQAVKGIASAEEPAKETPKRKRSTKKDAAIVETASDAPESPTSPIEVEVDTNTPTTEEKPVIESVEPVAVEDVETARKNLVDYAKEVSLKLDDAKPIKELLEKFGVKNFSTLPAESFNDFREALEELAA